MTFGNIRLFLKGHKRTAVFALSTECNCRCSMCGMWQKPVERISYDNAKKVIDFLLENHFLIIYFTGGEPTLHPQLSELVKYAHEAGIVTTMTSNGTAPPRILKRLKENGLQGISISLDHYNPDICETIRGMRGIMGLEIRAIQYAKSLGLSPYALAYLNPQIIQDGVENFIKYVNRVLKVPWGFCFPTEALNSYTLNYEQQPTHALKEALRTILYQKIHKRGMIANTLSYITDALRFLDGQPTRNRCRSGQDVVYIDWNGDVYPCFLKDRMFNILRDEPCFYSINCDACLTNCFREPSYLGRITLPLMIRELSY